MEFEGTLESRLITELQKATIRMCSIVVVMRLEFRRSLESGLCLHAFGAVGSRAPFPNSSCSSNPSPCFHWMNTVNSLMRPYPSTPLGILGWFAEGTQKVSFNKTFCTGNETREFKKSYSTFGGNVCFMIPPLMRSKDRQTEQCNLKLRSIR